MVGRAKAMRWSEEQYKAWQEGQVAKPNKYNATRTDHAGKTYDSKKEAVRASELQLLQEAGKISDLKEQVEIELIPPFSYEGKAHRGIYYRADFTYTEDGRHIVEDVKGYKTDTYRMKKKMLLQRYGRFIKFRET